MSDPAALLAEFQRASAANRAPEALALFDSIPASLTRHPVLRAQAAALAGAMGDRHREIAITRGLLADFPEAPELHVSLAYALRTVGLRDDAIGHLRKALSLRPGYGAPWQILAEIRASDISDCDFAEIEERLASSPSDEDAVAFHFALSWILEERGNFEGVARHVIAGNTIEARHRSEPPRPSVTLAQRSTEVVTADLIEARKSEGNDSQSPIFILGLPRSGSTLIEQILASHQDVEGTIELPVMPQLLRDLAMRDGINGSDIVDHVATLPGGRLRGLGEDYLSRCQAYRRTDLPRFTDKLPGNWSHAGLIRLIFPNAAVIDTRRHPMATGWSIYRHHFPGGPAFATRQDSIGKRYRSYLAMMEHMDRHAPGAVHRILHERLVDDLEGHVRALLNYCGLPFDRACLEFHRSERTVSTASSDQVRRPVSKDGIDRWQSYRPWLAELERALGDAVERWDR